MATDRGFPHFRLNLEQQGKRARELLKAARAGDAAARARFTSQTPKLAEAQHLIARDLRFDNWAALRHHISAMSRERESIAGLAGRTDGSATSSGRYVKAGERWNSARAFSHRPMRTISIRRCNTPQCSMACGATNSAWSNPRTTSGW